MTTTLDLSIFDFDLDEMLARAQSFCFDRPKPSDKPKQTQSDPDDQGIDPGLMTVIVDTLRDYHDACGAVVLAIRKWREAKLERSLARGHPRRPG